MLGLLGRNVLQLRMLGPLKQLSLTARLLSSSSEGDSSEQISSKHINKIQGDRSTAPASSLQKVITLICILHQFKCSLVGTIATVVGTVPYTAPSY
jgi:hypothetical protein